MKYSLGIVATLALSACTPALQSTDGSSATMSLGAFEGEPYLHSVYVGQGNCQIVTCPLSKKAVIFDCGSTSRDKPVKEERWPDGTVKTEGKPGYDFKGTLSSVVNKLGLGDTNKYDTITVSVSHADVDHYNLLPLLGRLIYNARHQRGPNPSTRAFNEITLGGSISSYTANEYAMLDGTLVTHPASILYYHTGPKVFTPDFGLSCAGDGVQTLLLATNTTNGEEENTDSSVYALFTKRNNKMSIAYITGDMTGKTADLIIEKANSYPYYGEFWTAKRASTDSVITTMAHHGADTHRSNNEEWAKFVFANQIIISAPPGDRKTQYNHPRCKAVANYAEARNGNHMDEDIPCHDNSEDSGRKTPNKGNLFYPGKIPNAESYMSSVSLSGPD